MKHAGCALERWSEASLEAGDALIAQPGEAVGGALRGVPSNTSLTCLVLGQLGCRQVLEAVAAVVVDLRAARRVARRL